MSLDIEDAYGGVYDAIRSEVLELKRRNAFLEERHEFMMRRLEALQDHRAEIDFNVAISLPLTTQCKFIVSTLMARAPGHVTGEWLQDNLPHKDRVKAREDEPLNHTRVLVSKVRRFFKNNGVEEAILSYRQLGYVITPEAIAWLRSRDMRG